MEAAPVLSVDEAIERHVKEVQSGNADFKSPALEALKKLANKDDANRAAIARRLVGLLSGGSANDQKHAATALMNLAFQNAANKVAIAAAGAIAPLVALVTNGSTDGQEWAMAALGNLANNSTANTAAIIAAGGVEAGAEHFSRLQSENASIKRRLAEDDVVSLRDGEAPLPAKESSALRDAHDKQQTALLRRVKEEKVAVEGARDRNDVVAAAASVAAATATADAADAAEDLRDAQELTDQLVLSENNKMSTIDELRGTVSERDARIEALEAEVREKDATIAELRERVGQLERPAPRGGGRAKRPRT